MGTETEKWTDVKNLTELLQKCSLKQNEGSDEPQNMKTVGVTEIIFKLFLLLYSKMAKAFALRKCTL